MPSFLRVARTADHGTGGKTGLFLRLLLLPASSAVLLFLASPSTSSLGWLAWIALIPLLLALAGARPGHGFLSGLAFGLVYYLFLLTWVIHALSVHGQVPWIFSAAALLGLSLYMGLYPAFFGLLFCRLRPKISPLFLAPVAWVALDGLRSFLFTGFPWLDLAYTQYRSPLLLQLADLTGHHGVTFLMVLVNILLLAAAGKGAGRKLFSCPGKAVLAAVLTIVAAFCYSGWRFLEVEKKLAGAETAGVTIIQGNIPQDEKWQSLLLRQSVETYVRLSAEAADQEKTDLVIWPETAFPYFPAEHPIFQEVREKLLEPRGLFLLSGAPHREPEPGGRGMRYFNSAFLFDPAGAVAGRYDKRHLVPFGEYIPFRKLFSFASPLVETLGAFTPGQSGNPLPGRHSRIGVLICFESIFPGLSRQMAANGATLLANLTNDAWFGRSNAPWQHLSMSVLRAVETRRSLARAANTGFSCFIDPLGRISGRTALFETRSLTAPLPLFSETTFYVKYGHLFFPGCLLVLSVEILRMLFFRRRLENTRQNENSVDQKH